MSLDINPDRYRREAAKCRRAAASAVEPTVREQWEALAAEYDALVASAQALSLFRNLRGRTPEKPPKKH